MRTGEHGPLYSGYTWALSVIDFFLNCKQLGEIFSAFGLSCCPRVKEPPSDWATAEGIFILHYCSILCLRS